jgi:hypothetical protein
MATPPIYSATFATLKGWTGPDVYLPTQVGYYMIITYSCVSCYDILGYDVSVKEGAYDTEVLRAESPALAAGGVPFIIETELKIPETTLGEGGSGFLFHNTQGTAVNMVVAGYILTYGTPFPIGPYVTYP